ncbi:hypothetical protein TWF281_003187 [Arthrobotrys megalospora]
MVLLGVLWLSLSVLELQVVNGRTIGDLGHHKRTPIDPHLYIRDMDHDEVPSLDHLLAIRDADSHVPISTTRITPGMLLDHILDMNPSLKPVNVEAMGAVQFNRYTFNQSVWNGGVADMLSRAPVTSNIKLTDLENAIQREKENEVPTGTYEGATPTFQNTTHVRRDSKPQQTGPTALKEFWDENVQPINLGGTPPIAPYAVMASDPLPNQKTLRFEAMAPTMMARCFQKNGKFVYQKLSVLREVADLYCTMFDRNMYLLVKGIVNWDVGEFSLGTIYKAVKLEDKRNMRVNFQFIYQPKGWKNEYNWYPMSLFTGMQGICHRILHNFLTPQTMMEDCKGKATPLDTRGGWVGMDIGDRVTDVDNRIVFRWAIDPYVRDSDEHPLPEKYEDVEKNNGLPRTDPSTIARLRE